MNKQPTGFGPVIKKIRKSKKISQGDFAKSIGISQTYLSQIEKERRTPSFAILKKIGKHLHVPIPVIGMFALQKEDLDQKQLVAWKHLQQTILSLLKSVFLPEV